MKVGQRLDLWELTPAMHCSVIGTCLAAADVKAVLRLASAVPHLRADAERIAVAFLHHDGGIEESVTRLDDLVPQADVVFCPVDCVSHDASLRARALCRRHAKPFVPLRSASATCFHREVEALAPRPERHSDTPAMSRTGGQSTGIAT